MSMPSGSRTTQPVFIAGRIHSFCSHQSSGCGQDARGVAAVGSRVDRHATRPRSCLDSTSLPRDPLAEPPPQAVNILIVDDDPAVLESAGRMLGRQGFVTATAFDGPGALQVHACLGPFEMLIAAVDIPEMDGPELAQQIRRRQPNLKVVYLTSPANVPETGASVPAGGDCSWSKASETLDGLTEIVASLLVRSTADDAAPHDLTA
jgi:CheY-like chemotaxis protein